MSIKTVLGVFRDQSYGEAWTSDTWAIWLNVTLGKIGYYPWEMALTDIKFAKFYLSKIPKSFIIINQGQNLSIGMLASDFDLEEIFPRHAHYCISRH